MKNEGQAPSGLACDRALDDIEAFLDDELTELASVQLERHLDTCGSCREELSWARKVHSGLRSLPVQPCPPAVDSGMARQAAERDEGSRWLAAARARWRDLTAGFDKLWSPGGWPGGVPAAAALTLALVAGALWLAGPWAPVVPEGEDPQANLAPLPSAGVGITPAELEQAEREARLALVYFSRVNRRASVTLRDDVKRIAETPRNTLRDLGLPILMSALPGASGFGSLDQEETL